jgi:cholesterol transport system auxiliary component
MAYSTQPHEIAYFSEREWGETPSQMLYPLLVRTLENTHAFRAVLTEPFAARYTYALRTEILELIQDFSSDSASLVLSLRFQLTDSSAKTVIATREVSVHEPMRERNSYAGVMAANVATAKALQQMAQYVLQATDASRE